MAWAPEHCDQAEVMSLLDPPAVQTGQGSQSYMYSCIINRCARPLELPAHLCSLAPAELRPAATLLQELELRD
eukprot:6580193-Prymnesium_polylepis.1